MHPNFIMLVQNFPTIVDTVAMAKIDLQMNVICICLASCKAIAVIGDLHTYNDFVKALSEALGKEIKYVRVLQSKA